MKIPLFKIFWDETDVTAVSDVIRGGSYWTTGPRIKEFEKRLAQYAGTDYAVVFSSGTSALHSVLIAHGIKEGDEVIVPSFSFISTANSVLFEKAVPVFADIEKTTFGLDPQDVKKKITNKTKAIIPVHFGGSPCLIKEIQEIAKENNLILIEDAAESLGAKVDGKMVGTFGDSAIFSFCQNKIITTGDGGVVVTNSEEVYNKLKLVRSHGRLEAANYFATNEIADYVSLGYNYRMSDITAALGLTQLSKIDRIIELRRKNSAYLNSKLSSIKGVTPLSVIEDDFQVYQLFTILVNSGLQTRDRLSKFLWEKGVSSKVYFDPIHLTHFYKNVLHYTCSLPITEEIAWQVLTLPMYPSLTNQEMDFVYEQINEFFNQETI